jgi:two-component system, OmpR family, phosphate regulon sensor histidine kinase PhoR
MAKNKIKIIITVMSLASLALIAFQVYWIGYTARSNREVFDANVREGLQQVVRRLEKQELHYLTQTKTAQEQRRRELLAISSQKAQWQKKLQEQKYLAQKQQTLAKQQQKKTKKLQPSEDNYTATMPSDMHINDPFAMLNKSLPLNEISIQFNIENPTLDEAEAIFQFNEFVGRQLRAMEGFYIDSSQVPAPSKNNKKNTFKPKKLALAKTQEKIKTPVPLKIDKLAQKSEIMKDVFSEYLLKERPLNQRISHAGLDSMLHSEMASRGIKIPIEYGIALTADTAKLLYLSQATMSPIRQQVLKNQGFKASLFPNDLLGGAGQLMVYFPDRQSFIRQSVWLNVLGSIAMISIVLGCFYVAVNTILKQKKLADIKNDFINNMTHEFKTPISTISLACQALTDGQLQQNSNLQQRYLGIIRDENQRLGTQVEKVLQTALLDRGHVKMKLTQIDINSLITNAIASIAPQVELKGGQIVSSLQAENAYILGDAHHLSNVVFNLIDNAIKYSCEAPKVQISTETLGTELLLRCQDNGIGIAPENHKTVFEKFYRVPTGNLHDVKGFGLGLSYVKKIVEEHHGRVSLSSMPGQGATFSVYLPLVLAQNPQENQTQHA